MSTEITPTWTTVDYFTTSINRHEGFSGKDSPIDFANAAKFVEEGNEWALARLTPVADDEHLAPSSKFYRAIAKAANAWARSRWWDNEGMYERGKREQGSAEAQILAIFEAIKSLRGGKVRIVSTSRNSHRGITLLPNQYLAGGAVASAFSGIDRT